jgi:hypothetical protein
MKPAKTNPEDNYTYPVKLSPADRALISEVRTTYEDVPRGRLMRAAIRKALKEELAQPGGLAPYFFEPGSTTPKTTRKRSKQSSKPVEQLSTSEVQVELEDLSEDGDFATNPFA